MAVSPHITMFFGHSRYSWTENYYATGAADLTVHLANGQKLAKLRQQILGDNVQLMSIRASFDDTFRDSLVTSDGFQPYADGSNVKLPEIGDSDARAELPMLVAKLRVDAGNAGQYHATRPLSGLPDALLLNTSGVGLKGKFKKNFDDFVTELTSGRWGMKVLQREGGFARKPCIRAVVNVAGLKVTCPGHGYVAQDKVRLGLWGLGTPAHNINGVQQVASVVDVDNFLIDDNFGTWVSGKPGYAMKRGYTIVTITQVRILGITSHKRGNSVSRPRGRR